MIEKIQDLYYLYNNTREYRLIGKHNMLLEKLSKRELQRLYRQRFGELNYESTVDLVFSKKNYINALWI